MANICIFIGNIVTDLELKKAGTADVLNFSIAKNKKYKDKETTVFIPLVAFNKTAVAIATYKAKGEQIFIEAEYQTSVSEKDGVKKYHHNFLVRKTEFLGGSKNKKEETNQSNEYTSDNIPF